MDLEPTHLRVKQAAAYLGVSFHTQNNWRCTGEGPRFMKLGRKVLYPMTEVEAFERRALHTANSVKVG